MGVCACASGGGFWGVTSGRTTPPPPWPTRRGFGPTSVSTTGGDSNPRCVVLDRPLTRLSLSQYEGPTRPS